MQGKAFELVQNVLRASDVVDELHQYRHIENCPEKGLENRGSCTCGAIKNNDRIRRLKELLQLKYVIDFAKD